MMNLCQNAACLSSDCYKQVTLLHGHHVNAGKITAALKKLSVGNSFTWNTGWLQTVARVSLVARTKLLVLITEEFL
jgi:hypothetical protein